MREEPARPIACALCGSSDARPLWLLDGFSFARCHRCSLIQQNPQPEPESVQGRYSQEYLEYELRNESAYLALAIKALADIGFDMQGRGRSFLDVGCATGALLNRLSESGFACYGVEICPETSAYARNERGLDVRSCVLEAAGFPSASMDFIYASHLIEHLNDPASFLDECLRILKPTGQLIITTPNAQGLQARLLGSRWRSVINDHLYLFSLGTLRVLLPKHGFLPIAWRTWGGWAAGLKPAFLKRPLDRLAKSLGFGDVMVVLARRSH